MSTTSQTPSGASESKTGFLKREEIVGKIIVGQDAMIVGTVKDLAVSVNGKVALQVEKKTATTENQTDSPSQELFVPSDEILVVGDFVLLKVASSKAGDTLNAPPQMTSSAPSGTAPPPFLGKNSSVVCPRCNYSNVSTSRFCVKCGSLLR